MGSIKKWLCGAAIVFLSVAGKAQAATPVFMLDGAGHPITSTASGGKNYLDVSATLTESATAAPGAAQPALDKIVGGVDTGTGLAHPLLVDSTGKLQITASSASVGATGSSVPSSADFIGAKNGSGNLVGLLTGQQTMANSLACVLPSDQSAIPVTGTFWQATQPVSAASLPLPTGAARDAELAIINTTLGSPFQSGASIGNTAFGISGTLPAFAATPTFNLGTLNGAATASNQTTEITALGTINTTLGSPFQVGGSIGNTSFGISGTLPAFAAIPAFKIDQTTPGTTNGVQVNAALPAGTNIIGKVSIDQTSPGTTNKVSIGTDGTVQTKAPLNSTGSGAAAAATVSTVITLTAPANAVGAYLMNIDTSTANIRWAVNRTATATLGQQLQPGRSEWIVTSHDISLVAESGTQTYDVQWISQ